MTVSLRNQYIAVSDGNKISYGGNQMLSESKTEREVGCGVVAALDLLLYLSRHDGNSDGEQTDAPIPLGEYNRLLHFMRRKYLPLIPKHGINGWMLTLGLNACFIKRHLPYLALWGVPYSRLWQETARMLEQDIPVIFSIGPNFPLFWQHNKLRLYTRRSDESYVPCTQTHAHYVMITAMDEQWLQISSWGKQYYIRKDEYLTYVKAYSVRLVSNIVLIRKKGRGE